MGARRFTVVDQIVDVAAPRALQELVHAAYADASVSTAHPTFGVRLVDTDEEPVIFIDDERVNVDSTGHLYEDLQRELTYGLLQRLAPRYLLIHAGAVRMDDLALLIPGDHDSGKSSLSLGIGQIGSFYSDDVTPIDPATVTPRPFPRELVLHSGTRQRLADLGIGHLAPPTPCCRFDGYDYLTATQARLSWAEPAPIGGSSSPAGSPVWRPS